MGPGVAAPRLGRFDSGDPALIEPAQAPLFCELKPEDETGDVARSEPSARRAGRWGESAAVIQCVLQAALEREGEKPDRAMRLAEAALLAFADYCGGREIYLPKAVVLKAGLRDRRMCAEFNGRNYHELAARYNLSTRRVRDIVAEGLQRSRSSGRTTDSLRQSNQISGAPLAKKATNTV